MLSVSFSHSGMHRGANLAISTLSRPFQYTSAKYVITFADGSSPQSPLGKELSRRVLSGKDLRGWSLELRLVTPLPEAVSSPIMEKREK